MLLLAGWFFLLPGATAEESSVPASALSMDAARIESIHSMREWLEALHAECVRAKGEGRFTFELQERVLTKSGESISRIVALEKGEDLANPKVSKGYRAAFEKNEEILAFLLDTNEAAIEVLQEEKLDRTEDAQALLDSPEWQMPHRILSQSRYWMSWSRYYRSFFLAADDPRVRNLLDEAVGGFSLTLLDIEEPGIVGRSLLGRALCFKEMRNYEKAGEDLNTIRNNVRHNDPLYMWSLYEQALIHYRLGRHDAALGCLERLDADVKEGRLSAVLGDAHTRLRERVVLEPRVKALLDRLDREEDKKGKVAQRLCQDAFEALRTLSRHDAEHASRLYRLVSEYPFFFSEFSYEDLGPIGNLALADDRFKKGEYDEAARRYRSLRTSSDISIQTRMDDIVFRSGYAYCQIGRWKDALACFDDLYTKFPKSKLLGKAACLEYVAAAGRHKQNPGPSSHARHIDSSKRYLKTCPNPGDRDGAHFLLGKHYRHEQKHQEARKEFSAIEESSPHYWTATYYVLKADVEELERQAKKQGKGTTGATKLYQHLQSQIERFQRLPQQEKRKPGVAEISPHMTILQARLLRSGPDDSCRGVARALEGFEKRFPEDRSLRLAAMSLRLQCYREHRMFDPSKDQILYLSREYPVDERLWSFLAEWAVTYDEEGKRWRKAGEADMAEAHAELALMVYRQMSAIASEQPPYGKFLDAVQLRMAEILTAMGETDGAGRIYEEILQRTPESGDALYPLGRIYEKQGRWDAALEVWRGYSGRLETGSDSWLESRYRIALAHGRMGRQHEACDVITMIRVLHPEAGDESIREKLLGLEREVCGKASEN